MNPLPTKGTEEYSRELIELDLFLKLYTETEWMRRFSFPYPTAMTEYGKSEVEAEDKLKTLCESAAAAVEILARYTFEEKRKFDEVLNFNGAPPVDYFVGRYSIK